MVNASFFVAVKGRWCIFLAACNQQCKVFADWTNTYYTFSCGGVAFSLFNNHHFHTTLWVNAFMKCFCFCFVKSQTMSNCAFLTLEVKWRCILCWLYFQSFLFNSINNFASPLSQTCFSGWNVLILIKHRTSFVLLE